MKKHIQIVVGILLLFASSSLLAQSNSVKKLTQSLRSHNSIEASFTYQTLSDSSDSEEPKQGTTYIQGEAYKFIMDDQHVISDGKTKWQYIIEDEEVMVGDVTDDDNPYKILDNLERDDSGFNFTLDKKGNLKRLEIFIDEGVKLVVNITEMKFDQEYQKNFFRFDEKAYPNVDIIDMR